MSVLVNLLAIGGGAGGGSACGGGGGAGQVVATTYTVPGSVTVTIGAAGNGGATGENNGVNGGNTSFGTVTALGGGGGGAGVVPNAGDAGACGGGGGGYSGGHSTAGGTATAGNAGGGGSGSAPDYSSGGGGGNSAPGAAGTSTNGGDGGNGVSNSITGAAVNYGAGGGGACGGGGGTAGAGGTGGGGAGSVNGAGGDATGYGSGGGGGAWDGSYYAGGNGSPGVVIISFPASVSFSYTGSYTAGSDGAGNTVWTLTTSGTLTFDASSVTPASCLRKCAITISGTQVAETGTYALPLNGSGGGLGVRLPDELFTLCQSDGGDICFTLDSAGTRPLPVQVVAINTSAKTAVIWVAVPLTAGSTATIYVWYQSSDGMLAQPPAETTYGSHAVWTGLAGVWHLGETGTGAVGDYADSTATGNNSTNTTQQPTTASGPLGGAQEFTAAGSGTQINLNGGAGSNLPTGTSNRTLSCWFKTTQAVGSGGFTLFAEYGTAAYNELVGLGLYNPFGEGVGPAITQYGTSVYKGGYTDGAWHLCYAVFNGTEWNLYVDGALQATGSIDTATVLGTALCLGNGIAGGGQYVGYLAEMRIGPTALSADYVATDYALQSSTSMVAAGTPQDSRAPSVVPLFVTDALFLRDTANPNVPTKHLSAADHVSLGQSNTVYNPVHHLAVTDKVSVKDTSGGRSTGQYVFAVDYVTVADSNTGHDDTVYESVADSLTITDVATTSGKTPINVRATDTLKLADATGAIMPIYLSVVDALQTVVQYAFDPDTLDETPIYAGLQDAVSLNIEHGDQGLNDGLRIGDSARCGVVRPGGITASATDALTLHDSAARAHEAEATDALELGDMALGVDGTPGVDSLHIGDLASVSVVRSLSVTDHIVVEQSFVYILPYTLVKRDYHPFVGTGTNGDPAPPPSTLIPNLKSGEFSLYYPPLPAAPADIVILRKPEFGNKDRLQFNRISRETRGGTLVVFADPMWPKTQTLVLTFAALKPFQAFNLQRFMETYIGLEIGLMDWEGRQWTGVIINPNDPVVQDSKYSFTGSFEFEGQLVSELTGQTV